MSTAPDFSQVEASTGNTLPDFSQLLATPGDSTSVWYTGTCHCRATVLEVKLPPLEATPERPTPSPVLSCNCSVCVKKGYLFVYARRADVVFARGWDELVDYRFASKTWDHKFCPTCGTGVVVDFLGHHPAGDILAVNARILEVVDIGKLNLQPVDGRSFQKEFNHP